MGLKWSDPYDIAIGLEENHGGVDILAVRFTDLHKWICALADFDDAPEASSEGSLEAIQMAWLDERD